MALQSVTQSDAATAKRLLTKEKGFCYFPRPEQDLFAVCAGVDGELALTTAVCLLESVKGLTQEAVSNSEMDGNQAYLVNFAVEAAQALLHSLERPYGYLEATS